MIEVSNLLLTDWDSPNESPWCVSYEARAGECVFRDVDLVFLKNGQYAPDLGFIQRSLEALGYLELQGQNLKKVVSQIYDKLSRMLANRDYRIGVNEHTIAKTMNWKKLAELPSYLKTETVNENGREATILRALTGEPGGADEITVRGSTYFRAESAGGLLYFREKGRRVYLDNMSGGKQESSHIYIFEDITELERQNFFKTAYYGVVENAVIYSSGNLGEETEERVTSLKGGYHVFADNGTFLLARKRSYLLRGRPQKRA